MPMPTWVSRGLQDVGPVARAAHEALVGLLDPALLTHVLADQPEAQTGRAHPCLGVAGGGRDVGHVAPVRHLAAVGAGDGRQPVVPDQGREAGPPPVVVHERQQLLLALGRIDLVPLLLFVGHHVAGRAHPAVDREVGQDQGAPAVGGQHLHLVPTVPEVAAEVRLEATVLHRERQPAHVAARHGDHHLGVGVRPQETPAQPHPGPRGQLPRNRPQLDVLLPHGDHADHLVVLSRTRRPRGGSS